MNTPYTIRHDIPGRLRIRVSRLNESGSDSRIENRLIELDGVVWTRINRRCASIVISYDPARLPRDDLLERLRTLTAVPKDDRKQAAPPPIRRPGASGSSSTPCTCAREEKGLVRKAFIRFAAISVILGGAVFRQSILGRTVAQTATSPLGLAALFFTLPLARSALERLKERRVTLDGFLAVGSVAATISGEALTSLEILWINSGAELLSTWIGERSRKNIASILQITSHHTFVLVDGVEVERRVEDLEPGDRVVLHTGEKISVDGTVVSGQAMVDEAPITGRAEPEHKKVGDAVHAGTFVREGVIHVLAESVGDRTYLARVMHKVECALENRAPIEGVADRLASNLVKLGLGATLATFVVTSSAWRAFTVLLVMACPCATVLAASTAVSAAISAAARRQILIKGGRYLEEIGKCDLVLFDKTGTLTTTQPVLTHIVTMNGHDESSLLQLACSTETHNHHPLALAVLREARERGISALPHEVCEYHLGLGMRAVVQGRELLVGNARLARRFQAQVDDMEEEAMGLKSQGLTVLYVFQDKAPLGLLCFASQIRPEAPEVLRRLRNLGARQFVLVTGDEEASALALARQLGIEECHASLMPEEKAEIVRRFKEQSRRTLLVGDGINDALALTEADVGVALGTAGSEVAVEAADIALARDNLEALADVYALSRRTLDVVYQNFWLATGSNIIGVTLGAMGLLSPVTAGLVHVAHSLGVLLNSSRLLSFNAPPEVRTEREG